MSHSTSETSAAYPVNAPDANQLPDEAVTMNLAPGEMYLLPLDRMHTTPLQPAIPTHMPGIVSRLPAPLHRPMMALLERASAPAEEFPTLALRTIQPEQWGWLWFPILGITSAAGLIPIAYAYSIARQGSGEENLLFWLGLLMIFLPVTLRLLSSRASRAERLGLLGIAGLCFFLVRVLLSPLAFYAVDDFLHWRTAEDILRSGHLFSENSVLPVSPYYPALEIVTNALSTLTGLNTLYSSLIVLGVARIVVILGLFLFFERITISGRIAGIATILYTANPHFLLFDTTFAYGSLAIALAAFVLFLLALYETMKGPRRWILFAAWISLGALVVTHHTTTFFLDLLLLTWALTSVFPKPARLLRSGLAATALLALVLSFAWISVKGNPVISYLFSYFQGGVQELGDVLLGSSGAHQLFHDYAGQQAPLWERLIAIASVVLIVISLPLGLLCIWQRHRSNRLIWALGLASLLYPLSQAFRLTNGGTEISDRIGAYLFIPIACVLALFLAQFWPERRINWKQTPLVVCALSVLFIGGAILGSGPSWATIPGPYLVVAGGRSVEPNGIQTAIWAHSYLGPDNRVGTDNINRILMNSYGDQMPVTHLEDQIDISTVFFAPKLDASELSVLRRAKVRYLVVDLRLSTALPRYGFYFEPGEPGDYLRTTPIDRKALTKFDTYPQIKRVYDSGDIVIYDVGELLNAHEKS